MKKLLTLFFFLTISVGSQCRILAENKTIAELFKEMPDSIMPYLTENNRLDMLDFMSANMKAEVTNLLDCKTEMTKLTADSISIKMSESMIVDILLIPIEEEYDSCHQVICLLKTYIINERPAERVASFYSLAWRPLNLDHQFSSFNFSDILKRDEEVFSEKNE